MRFTHRSSAIVAAVFSLTLFTTGCENKVSQCNKLIKVANDATTELKAMGQEKASDQTAQMTKFAITLDKYAKDVKAVELKDEKLVGFKQRLGDLYSTSGEASRSLVEAANKKDEAGLKSSLQKLMEGSTQETTIVSELNGYCSAK
jgi:oligoendopeptidase F